MWCSLVIFHIAFLQQKHTLNSGDNEMLEDAGVSQEAEMEFSEVCFSILNSDSFLTLMRKMCMISNDNVVGCWRHWSRREVSEAEKRFWVSEEGAGGNKEGVGGAQEGES